MRGGVQREVSKLPANGWRIGLQEVTWTADGVIGVSDLCCCRALSASASVTTTVRILATIAQEALVVGTAALPTEFAWAASNWAVAGVALIVSKVVAAGATQ